MVDRTLLARAVPWLWRIVLLFGGVTLASFLLNVVSGLRYTRISADILFRCAWMCIVTFKSCHRGSMPVRGSETSSRA